MYCDYYGFREKPFNITPDPGFIFLSAQHNEAFAHLLYGIDHHVGFIVLTGEVGAGKTTVIRTLLGQLDPGRYRTALVFNPCLSSLGLMQTINREYGLSGVHADTAELLAELNRFLLEENAAGRTVVLVVDEAQNLAPAVLEQVRLISNLETARDKLIQIVLVGQPELRELLTRPELRQLGQRIGVNYHLCPMSLADTRNYITHRLDVAGRRSAGLFTSGAVQRIFRFSGGLPRLINLACDRALLLGYTKEWTPITAAMAATAIADVRLAEKKGPPRYLLAGVGVVFLTVCLLGGGYFWYDRQQVDNKPIPPATSSLRPVVAPALLPAPAAPPPVVSAAAVARELGPLAEKENALAAFNNVARLWHVAPATWASPQPDLPEVLARERGLDTVRYSGNLEGLLRFDAPAILELKLPGVTGRRYLALIASGSSGYTVAPPLVGRRVVTTAELEGIWSGRAWLPWKNRFDIPPGLKPGVRGKPVERLQGLLRGAGVYRGPVTGVLDRSTLDAVKLFQAARGTEADGAVGRQTLFHLYRVAVDYAGPALADKEHRP